MNRSESMNRLQKSNQGAILYSQFLFEEAMRVFLTIPDPTSKVMFNIGRCCEMLDRYEEARFYYEKALAKDGHLAIAYFAVGNLCFYDGKMNQAISSYEKALRKMRNSMTIDYRQLGLEFILEVHDILLNIAVCRYQLGDKDKAFKLVSKSSHAISKQISSSRSGSPLFQFPSTNGSLMKGIMGYIQTSQSSNQDTLDIGDILEYQWDLVMEGKIFKFEPNDGIFRPLDVQLSGLRSFDFLGKANLIAATDSNDLEMGFKSYRLRKKAGQKHFSDPLLIAPNTATTYPSRKGSI